MATQNNIRALLANHPLIPVVTFQDADDPVAFMDYLVSIDVQ